MTLKVEGSGLISSLGWGGVKLGHLQTAFQELEGSVLTPLLMGSAS